MRKYLIASGMAACLMMMEVSASGKIGKIQPTADGLELTMETTVGESYQIQCRTTLLSGDWVDVGAPFEATASTSVRVVVSSESQCYLRVVKKSSIKEPAENPPPPPPPPPPSPDR